MVLINEENIMAVDFTEKAKRESVRGLTMTGLFSSVPPVRKFLPKTGG